MADPRGFLRHGREVPARRPVDERLRDWREVYPDAVGRTFLPIVSDQASRCMDCGIPFCHEGCPLGNLIPEWNDLVFRDDWRAASERLHATNNFPEFTGRICPAPCESACVLGIADDPVTIKHIEVAIADVAFDEGFEQPRAPDWMTGSTVAVVGSGPAGLAAAQQLTRAGHTVVVYERADAVGGLLRYGIPDFKLEKHLVDRRLGQMEAEGTRFETGVDVGRDLPWRDLRQGFDALVIATGATVARDLPVAGRLLDGVHQAMDYLPQANRVARGQVVDGQIHAAGRHVVIIGGGDTGADCLGTALRQRPASVTQLEILARPGDARSVAQPWPTYPMVFRVSSAHEEGGDRMFGVSTEELLADPTGRVQALRLADVVWRDGTFRPVEGTAHEIAADLVLLALGFSGPETDLLGSQLGLEVEPRGVLRRDADYATPLPGVFVCGDAGRGQSLVVWAIAEGRAAAASVDRFLRGSTTLPSPVTATQRSLTA